MMRGLAWYLSFILVYAASVAVLVKALPRKSATITGLVFLLSHYFAACTWLVLRFDLGMMGPIIYATDRLSRWSRFHRQAQAFLIATKDAVDDSSKTPHPRSLRMSGMR